MKRARGPRHTLGTPLDRVLVAANPEARALAQQAEKLDVRVRALDREAKAVTRRMRSTRDPGEKIRLLAQSHRIQMEAGQIAVEHARWQAEVAALQTQLLVEGMGPISPEVMH